MTGLATRSAHRVPVADSTRAVMPLPGADYAISFALDTSGPGPIPTLTAEDWARAVFEKCPLPVRSFLIVGWRFGLGLRLGPRPSSDHVLGWSLLSTTTDTAVIGVTSWLLTAHNVIEVTESQIRLTTIVRYDQAIARPIWTMASQLHRLAVPRLLDHAAGLDHSQA